MADGESAGEPISYSQLEVVSDANEISQTGHRAAIRVLEAQLEVVRTDEDRALLSLELGLLHLDAGELEAASARLAVAGPSAAAQRLRTELALRAGRTEAIAEALARELELAEGNAARASLRVAQGRLEANPEHALEAFAEAAALESGVEACLAAERLLVRAHRFSEAADVARVAAERLQRPSIKGEWLARAARYALRAEEPEAAQRLLRRASELSPSGASIALGWELLAARSGDAARWIELRSFGLETAPDLAAAIDAGILARYRLRDLEMARGFFEHAWAGSEGEVRRFLAAELMTLVDPIDNLGRWLEVTQERRRLATDPARRAQLDYELARAHLDLADDRDSARACALACLEAAPQHGPALELLSRVDGSAGAELAEAFRREAATYSDPAARADAWCRVAEADAGAAVDVLGQAEAELPGDLGLLAGLEQTADPYAPALTGARERALPHLTHPASRQRALLFLADSLAERGEADAARELLMQAAESEGLIALALDAKRQLEGLLPATERIAILKELLEADPWDALHRWTGLAATLLEQGDPDELAPAVAAVLDVAPERHPFRLLMRRLLVLVERPDELRALYDASARRGAGVARARWLERAADVSLHELDQPAEALERLSLARESWPGSPFGALAAHDILAREGDPRARLALPWDEQDPVATLRRGALLEAVGDDGRAIEAYRAAEAAGLTVAAQPLERLLASQGEWQALVLRAEESDRAAARLRAVVLASEWLGDPALTSRHLGDADGALELSLLHHRESADTDPDRPGILARARAASDDPVFDRALGREDAFLRGASGEGTSAWRAIAEGDPDDVLAVVHTTLSLSGADRTKELVDWMQGAPAPPDDSSLAMLRSLRLARWSESLGSLRAAADASHALTARPPRPFLAYLQAPRLHRLLDDAAGYERSLGELARRLARGPASARAWLSLAEVVRDRGDHASALETLVRAHRAAPTYYPSLQAIAAASADHPGPLIDALMRVQEAETRPAQRVAAGVYLGKLLVECERLELAREVLERVVATDPSSRAGQLWLAEVYERLEEPEGVFDALESVVDHGELEEATRLRALVRQIDIALELDAPDRATRAAMKLARIDEAHPKVLEATLAVARSEDDPRRMADVLERLSTSGRVSEGERVGYLFELATIQGEKLGDVSAAIRALGDIRSNEATEETVKRLLTLGEGSGRWDLASQALESALDGAAELDDAWELTIRRRLVAIFEGPLEDGVAVARQLRRIVALEPTDLTALRKLAEASGDPGEHVALRRLLFAAEPEPETLDALREDFAAAEDEDAVFLAEAVAVGMDWASEEARYFYRQRRAFLPTPNPEHALTDAQLEALLELPSGPVRALLAALEPVLHEVFPPDFTAYGVRLEDPPSELPEGAVAETAMLFGCAPPAVHEVGAQLGPAVEHHAKGPLLLLPRTLIDAPQRQQRFALGCLFYRLSTQTTWSDPCRLEPLRPSFLRYLLEGLLRELRGEEAPTGKAILDDVQARLRAVMTDDVRARARAAPGWEELDPERVEPDGLLRATALAAGKAGMIAAQDPAAALEALGRWPQLLHVDGKGRGLHDAVVGYAISEAHASLRETLGLGLIR